MVAGRTHAEDLARSVSLDHSRRSGGPSATVYSDLQRRRAPRTAGELLDAGRISPTRPPETLPATRHLRSPRVTAVRPVRRPGDTAGLDFDVAPVEMVALVGPSAPQDDAVRPAAALLRSHRGSSAWKVTVDSVGLEDCDAVGPRAPRTGAVAGTLQVQRCCTVQPDGHGTRTARSAASRPRGGIHRHPAGGLNGVGEGGVGASGRARRRAWPSPRPVTRPAITAARRSTSALDAESENCIRMSIEERGRAASCEPTGSDGARADRSLVSKREAEADGRTMPGLQQRARRPLLRAAVDGFARPSAAADGRVYARSTGARLADPEGSGASARRNLLVSSSVHRAGPGREGAWRWVHGGLMTTPAGSPRPTTLGGRGDATA